MRRRHSRQELQELLGIAEEPLHGASRSTHVGALPLPLPSRPPRTLRRMERRSRRIELAYDAWCAYPGADSYLVYRAAEDRADAAEVALATL